MIDGGALTVTLSRSDGAIAATIDAPPMLSLTRMMAGRPAAEAARMAALVFPSDPEAEEAAARAALGLPPADGAARRLTAEALRDHALKLCVAWPRAVGFPHDPGALTAAGALTRDGGAALSAALFGRCGPPERLADLEDWMRRGETAPARVLRHVWRRWDSRWGRAELPLWSPGERLGAVDWAAAEIDGRPVETGLAACVAEAGLMREIEARRGRGIAWRLAARLVHAARLLEALAEGDPGPAPASPAPGLGVCAAAHGAVLLHVEAEGDRVRRFDRLSPTDCALHADGLLRRVIATLPASPAAPLAAVAALALETVDAALPTRLVLAEPATA
jgi:hypothetical protein